MRHTYILLCADSTYYTGVTNDLEKRLDAHNHSKTGAKYTKARRPVTIIRHQSMPTKTEAMQLERRLKRLSRPEKEEWIATHSQ